MGIERPNNISQASSIRGAEAVVDVGTKTQEGIDAGRTGSHIKLSVSMGSFSRILQAQAFAISRCAELNPQHNYQNVVFFYLIFSCLFIIIEISVLRNDRIKSLLVNLTAYQAVKTSQETCCYTYVCIQCRRLANADRGDRFWYLK